MKDGEPDLRRGVAARPRLRCVPQTTTHEASVVPHAGRTRAWDVNTIEDVDLADSTYDITYFNGNSSYIADSKPVYGKC